MLNKEGARELAYVARIKDIRPIEGKDRVECAVVNGWTIMVRKGQFQVGDLGIYFEIDSRVPATKEFEFLAAKHYKIKTQKYGNFYSQGLLMGAEDFGWVLRKGNFPDEDVIDTGEGTNGLLAEGDFLTSRLGVVYSVEEDNKRKAKSNPDAKINAALARHPKIAKRWGKTIKKNKFLRKMFILLFGRKKDVRNWPAWVVKTDEERVQNMPWILEDKSEWIVTEKLDGTSTTFTMRRGKFGKYDFYTCSRNVVFDTPNKACYYDTNVYVEMGQKYDMENVLKKILDADKSLEWVTIQGETFGAGIQKRDYGMTDHDFRAFNFITSKDGRWNSREAAEFLADYGIKWVPILGERFVLPDTVEELLKIATDKSVIDGGMREGLVFRSQDGTKSFKAVSNEFLVKYHQ